ncbi:OmpA family protein [Aquimarina sp. 2304DJ70-9]|uniref:OmpA family protein n=1 Tax=Aquimarina penaris TaxID=3231044 RepID=UPI0034620FD8
MKKVLWTICLSLILGSCKNNNENQSITQTEDSVSKIESIVTETATNTENRETNKQTIKEFNWNNIPVTNHDIGEFPYITPPKGMEINKKSRETETFEFSKLEMFDGRTNFTLEGRVSKMIIKMENPKEKWGQYVFDKSVSEYLRSIGAILITDKKIPREILKTLNESDKFNVYNFIMGDPYNQPIRMYALNQEDKKIGFQVYSNSATGEIGVVEVKDFEQTIEKITAKKIKSEIDQKGFVSLQINFDTGKSRIKTDSYGLIDEITKMLKSNPNLKVSIEGHTDDVGDDNSNLRLSKNRARAVLLALTDEGIDESRLHSEGFGETKPVANNTTEKGKAKNRRVELHKM